MLLYRYLSRQLFASTLAVAFVLTLVLVFGRFIKYLGDAAEGRIQAEVLLQLLTYRLPGFLEMILPMALFMGILLANGRMYADSEMTVLRASGIGNMQLARMCFIPALMMALVVGSFSLFLSPWGFATVEQTMAQQRARPEIDMVSAGRFYKRTSNGVQRATYARDLVANRTQLENVFLSEFPAGEGNNIRRPSIITAASGHRVQGEDGNEYLELENGFRYEGQPGRANFHVVAFQTHRLRIDGTPVVASGQTRALPTASLLERNDLSAIAELQWRLSVPLMCFIAVLLAVPLSRVQPRQGRFFKLLPSVLLFLAYLILLIGSRQWVEKGAIPASMGPWWVHLSFGFLGLAMIYGDEIRLRLTMRSARQ